MVKNAKSNNHDKDNDYPSLGTSSTKIDANFVKNDNVVINDQKAWKNTTDVLKNPSEKRNSLPEETRNSPFPPPGFDPSNTKQKSEATAAPPGFQSTSNTGQHSTDPMERKNNKSKTSGVYLPPKDFVMRNSNLLSLITTLMGGPESSKFSTFKALSGQFRKGAINCDSYHRQCLELVDLKSFETFFPELLCLLPDVNKQGVSIRFYSISIIKCLRWQKRAPHFK